MTLDKSKFNIAPYYDDFDETKKFLQILFKPGYSIQARELTQLQTILSNQIGRMADHIFENGDVIQGAGITERKVKFIRLDNTAGSDSATVDINNLIGYDLYYDHTVLSTNASGTDAEAGTTTKVLGRVVHAEEASGDDPHKVIFLEITKDNKDESDVFATAQSNIKCSNPNIDVTLVVKKDGGAESVSSVSITTPASHGDAVLVSIEKGLFYVDGYFVMNDPQTIAVSELDGSNFRKFFITDRTVSVGFSINRRTDTVDSDVSLRDPSQGSYNYNAPGGDRFVIELLIKQIPYIFDEDGYRTDFDTDNYFEWARIIKGETFKKLKYPEYAQLEETLARRTYDESGHYTVQPFGFAAEKYDDVFDPAVTGRSDHYNYCACGIESGKAYVRGYEFELQNTEHLVGRKARTEKVVNDSVIDIDAGNYVLVEHNFDGLAPLFTIDGAFKDNSFNLVGGSPEPTYKKVNLSFQGAGGEQIPIGCARITQIALHSINQGPTSVGSLYRIYLSEIAFGEDAGLAASANLLTMKDVKNISDPISGKKLFQLHIPSGQETNDGVIQPGQEQLLYALPGGGAIKEITGLDYYVQRDFELSFTDSGADGIWKATASSPSSNAEFQGTNGATTITDEGSSVNVLDDLVNTQQYMLSVDGYLFDMSPNSTGDFGGNAISVDSGNQSISLYVSPPSTQTWTGTKKGHLVTAVRINADAEVKGSPGTTIRKKVLKRKTITITNQSNADASTTMWNPSIQNGFGINLGYPDVLRVEKVEEIGSGTDYTNDFDFYNGQSDTLYDHAYVNLSPSFVGGTAGPEGAWAAGGAGFRVTFIYFDQQLWGSGSDHTDYSNLKYPIVANSYVHGDHEVNELENGDGITQAFGSLTAETKNGTIDPIPVEQSTFALIPPYVSRKGEGSINLNDAVDFRPIKVGKWDENHPEYGEVRGTWTPQDGKIFYADFVKYLSRVDKLVLTRNRDFKLLTGIPGEDPMPPTHDEDNEMALFNILWPAFTYSCEDVNAQVIDNQRYTMADIGELDKRITAIEETSQATEIEQEAKTEATQFGNKFTNVMQTDNFANITKSDILADEYNVAINPVEGCIRPSASEMNLNLFEHNTLDTDSGITQSSDNLWHLTPSANPVSTVNNLTGNSALYPNPFSKSNWMGDLRMSPSGDDWFAMHKTSRRVKKTSTYWVNVKVPGKGVGAPGHPLPNYHTPGQYLHKYISGPAAYGAVGASHLWNRDNYIASVGGVNSPRYKSEKDAWVRSVSTANYPFGGWQKDPKGYKRCNYNYGCVFKWKREASYKDTNKQVAKTRTTWKTIHDSKKERVRPKEITLTATYMKPNTRFWVFIDGKRATENSQASTGYIVANSSTMRTDAKGNASVKIQIPKDNPYHEGDILIRLCDNKQNLASLTTTAAEAMFVVGGVGKQSYANIKTTRPVRAKRDTVTKERIVQDAASFTKGQNLSGVADYFDPLAQIFEIDPDKYGAGIFATSVDLFFREIDGDQVDDNNTGDPLPFSVELRPLLNDQPHPTTAIPLSFTTKDSGMQATKTGPDTSKNSRFTFSSPIFLSPGRYALVCKTNSQNYALWGTQYGSAGVSSDGTATLSDVERQPYVGGVYLPQNNGSRFLDKNQSIMFKLNRATFPTDVTPRLVLEGASADAINQHGFTVGSPDFHEAVVLSQDMNFPDTELKYYLNSDDPTEGRVEGQPYLDIELKKRNTFDLNKQIDPAQRPLIEATLSTSNENITPVVDMDRLSIILRRLEFSNSTENEHMPKPPRVQETPVSRYIGKVVNCGHEANVVRVSFEAIRKSGTNYKVYTRCTTADDTSIVDKEWVQMSEELTNSAMPADVDDYYSQRFYYQKPVGFTDFQIKIVLTGDPIESRWSKLSRLKSFALYDPELDTTAGGVGQTYSDANQPTEEETGGEG